MTDRLDEIQARLDAATPGEWEATHVEPNEIRDSPEMNWVAHPDSEDEPDRDSQFLVDCYGRGADATFIAAAPTDIAYLLERVRAWRRLAEDATEYLIELRGEKGLAFTDQWASDLEARRAALTEGESE